MAYGDFKGFKKITAANKILRDKVFNIAKDSKYDGYQTELAFTVYKSFDKKKLLAVVSLRLQINLLLNLHLKMSN